MSQYYVHVAERGKNESKKRAEKLKEILGFEQPLQVVSFKIAQTWEYSTPLYIITSFIIYSKLGNTPLYTSSIFLFLFLRALCEVGDPH